MYLFKTKSLVPAILKESIDAIAVMGGYKITPDLMKSMPNLKIIACYGVGYDAIDVNFAKNLGII